MKNNLVQIKFKQLRQQSIEHTLRVRALVIAQRATSSVTGPDTIMMALSNCGVNINQLKI
jgi:hypothetical protein